MKNILLCTDGSMFAEVSYKYGAWLAQKLDSQINVLSVTDIRSQQVASTGNLSGSIGLGAAEELLEKLVNLEHERAKLNHQKAKLILKTAEEILKNLGVNNLKLTHKTGFLVDCLEEFEQETDLILLGKRGENADFASEHLGGNLERIIRSSKKPCFVTPREFKKVEKIIIAYDGSATGKKILQFLTDFPLLVEGLELHIITVAKNEAETDICRSRLEYAQEKLSPFNPIIHLLESEPEKAIVNYVKGSDNCLLVMGAYGHSRIRRLVIGSTTAQVLRGSRVPVLLLR
jgi:nucleotide-binding universal stress UspA family protein